MDIGVKKEILTELYNKGKLSCAQICDLVDKTQIYDIIVFKYYHEPDEDGFMNMEILDYAYGACAYNDNYRKRYCLPTNPDYYLEAILNNAERVFKALSDRNIVSEHYRTYTFELKGNKDNE